MNRLFVNNGAEWRLMRTIIQGIIGVIIAYIDVLIGFVVMPDALRPFVVAMVMAVLSPIMKSLGKDAMDKPELDDNHFEGDDDGGEQPSIEVTTEDGELIASIGKEDVIVKDGYDVKGGEE